MLTFLITIPTSNTPLETIITAENIKFPKKKKTTLFEIRTNNQYNGAGKLKALRLPWGLEFM